MEERKNTVKSIKKKIYDYKILMMKFKNKSQKDS